MPNTEEIINILKNGGVGVLATDTQYGIVTQALNENAVEKVYKLRKRSPDKPFIILISSIDDLKLFDIAINDITINYLSHLWPNPVSVILPIASNDFAYLHRGTNSLAFRIPNNPDLLNILKETGPLIAPSANIEGHPYAKTIEEAKNYFEDSVDFYEDKGRIESNPSTLIKIGEEGIEILRQGKYDKIIRLMPIIKQTMFREYDLRGREADDELNEQSIYLIGKGFGTYLRRKNINMAVVGHDARATSESFTAEFIKGLNETGINVTNIGTVTTPMGYWAQHYFNIKGGAVITASHNPVGWNGAKISDDLSKTLSGAEIQEVYKITSDNNFETGQGTEKKEDIHEAYIKDLLSKVKISKKYKILVNTGNGTAAIIAPELLRQAGCEIVEHNTNIDPTYPNYTPNPENAAMMKDTGEQTVSQKCDFGFAIDGDGDRLGLVDEKGELLTADKILILLSRLFLKDHPGEKVMFDVKVSESLPEDIKAHGGIPVMYKTGHSLIKAEMHKQNIHLTGEMSGHVFFGKEFGYYGFDDAEFEALKLLEYLSSQDKPLSEILASLPHYLSTPLINVDAPDEVKHEIIKKIVQQFKDENYNVVDVDGARVYADGGWGLVRASNTTPMLVLRFEAKTEEGIEKLKTLFKSKLDQFPEISKEWKETA